MAVQRANRKNFRLSDRRRPMAPCRVREELEALRDQVAEVEVHLTVTRRAA